MSVFVSRGNANGNTDIFQRHSLQELHSSFQATGGTVNVTVHVTGGVIQVTGNVIHATVIHASVPVIHTTAQVTHLTAQVIHATANVFQASQHLSQSVLQHVWLVNNNRASWRGGCWHSSSLHEQLGVRLGHVNVWWLV